MRLALSIIMTAVILVALFTSYVKSDMQLNISLQSQESLENWSFEGRDYSIPGDGVYRCPPWETNNGGWRELRGDVDGNGICNMIDIATVARAYGSYPGHPNWNPDADLNGDGVVNMTDISTATADFGKTANRFDGSYSWYTDGGGDYLMWQQLNSDAAMALAGETVIFEFQFYPTSVAPDGSQNNARVEILYLLNNWESNTVFGAWVAPTSLGWWDAYVITQLPSNVIALTVIIHGKPDFKSWIDSAKFSTWNYDLYYTTPPYSNQGSDPPNGTWKTMWNAATAALGNLDTGLVLVYAMDQSGIGAGKMAHVQFNNDPPTGNSPSAYETGDFSIGAYWYFYGYLGQGGFSALRLTIYLYYLEIGVGWVKVGEYTWGPDSIQYPGQTVWYWGSVSFSIPLPPSGTGTYAITTRAYAYAAGGGGTGSAVADAWHGDYAMWIDLLKISD